MNDTYSDILTLEDVCEILNIGKNTAYRLLTNNQIHAFKIGHVWKIPRESINEYIKTSINPNA